MHFSTFYCSQLLSDQGFFGLMRHRFGTSLRPRFPPLSADIVCDTAARDGNGDPQHLRLHGTLFSAQQQGVVGGQSEAILVFWGLANSP